MKIFQCYEKGYKEQQVAVKETARQLINEAVSARLAAGKVQASEMALYGAIMEEAESAAEYANKQYEEEKKAEGND